MIPNEIINNILITENAYIYVNTESIEVSLERIEELFNNISSAKNGQYLLNQRKIQSTTNTDIHYSICVFKYIINSSLINSTVHNWTEEKIAYLLIVEIKNYIIISKKNISNLQNFIDSFEPLDYSILSNIFIEENTVFEKFNMQNINPSNNSIKEKSVVATNLKENFSTIGAYNYTLNNLRLRNNQESISVTLNSSRINKFGEKKSINSFCIWANNLIGKIENYSNNDTFLSIFANNESYESYRNNLIPISIIFDFSSIYKDLDEGRINNIIFRYTNSNNEIIDREINLTKFLHRIELLYNIINNKNTYEIDNSISKDLVLKMNAKSITISSKRLNNIKIIKNNGCESSIIEYINIKNKSLIYFDSINLCYTNKKLFSNSQLLGNIRYFLNKFHPHDGLKDIRFEKGNPTLESTSFCEKSIFKFVEDNFKDKYKYFVCDDLATEWADHIGITDNKITFFHSKYNVDSEGASPFHVIVSQALKNIGYFSPIDSILDSKINSWNGKYANNTNISRIRKGGNSEEIIQEFKETIKKPEYKKSIFLVINFFSKSTFEKNITDIINREYCKRKKETIQCLWVISSLISTCQELNIEIEIHCRP